MPKRNFKIELSKHMRARLEELASSSDEKKARNAKIILSSENGTDNYKTVAELSFIYSISTSMIQKIRKAFSEKEYEKLFPDEDLHSTANKVEIAYKDFNRIFTLDNISESILFDKNYDLNTFLFIMAQNQDAEKIISDCVKDHIVGSGMNYKTIIQKIGDYYDKLDNSKDQAYHDEQKKILMWFIERYKILDSFKKENFTAVFLGFRNYDSRDLREVKENTFLKNHFGKYSKSLYNNNIDYIDDMTVSRYKPLIGKKSNTKNGSPFRADYLSLAAYLEAFSIANNIDLVKLFRDCDCSSSSDNNETYIRDEKILLQMMYDVSLGLDFEYIWKIKEYYNQVYFLVFERILPLIKLAAILTCINKKAAEKLVKELSVSISDPDVLVISKYNEEPDPIKKFYLFLKTVDFKRKYSFFDLKTMNFDIKLSANKAYTLFNEQVKIKDYVPSGIKVKIVSYEGPRLKDVTGKRPPKVYRDSPDFNIVHSYNNEACYEDFCSENKEMIKNLCLYIKMPDTYEKNFDKNYAKNFENLKIFTEMIVGDHTDGLTITICHYLFFAEAFHEKKYTKRIGTKFLSGISPSDVVRIRKKVENIRLYVLMKKNDDDGEYAAAKEITSKVLKIMEKIFEGNDIISIHTGLIKLYSRLMTTERPYYEKYNIIKPYSEEDFDTDTSAKK